MGWNAGERITRVFRRRQVALVALHGATSCCEQDCTYGADLIPCQISDALIERPRTSNDECYRDVSTVAYSLTSPRPQEIKRFRKLRIGRPESMSAT